MKKMERSLFEQLCASAGKSLDEAMRCVVAAEGTMLVIDETHADYPIKKQIRRCCGGGGPQ